MKKQYFEDADVIKKVFNEATPEEGQKLDDIELLKKVFSKKPLRTVRTKKEMIAALGDWVYNRIQDNFDDKLVETLYQLKNINKSDLEEKYGDIESFERSIFAYVCKRLVSDYE